MPRVVVVKVRGDFRSALKKGFSALGPDWRSFLKGLFWRDDIISLKVNALAGRMLSTSPALAQAMAELLVQHLGKEAIIWDRTERELKRAGYKIKRRGPIKVIATDSPRMGYHPQLILHKDIGSLFSRIQMFSSSSISLAIAKDHDIAGVTLSMKNYYGAIHNPNKYHDFGCSPFIAELFETEPISSKHRLSIIDITKMQFHRGPSYHSRWFTKPGLIVLSQDPVAADAFVWKLIERYRQRAGLPSLKEEGRQPEWIFEAEKMGLGKAEKYEVVEL